MRLPLIISALALALPFVAFSAPAASPAFYPKNLAAALLGAKIRVNATTGVHLANGYAVPVTFAGTQDVGALLSDDFDGLEFAPGAHSFTIVLPEAQAIDRVGFLNRSAEGTFTALISGSDPQLLGPAANRIETKLAGPDMVNSAVFQPQMARYIQVDLKISKRGTLGRFAVYGHASDLDYALKAKPAQAAPAPAPTPAPAPAAVPGAIPLIGAAPARAFPSSPVGAAAAPVAEPPLEINVAALSAGARVTGTSSAKSGAEPAWLLADGLDGVFFFNPGDPAPACDIDFGGARHADHAVVFVSGPPSRVEAIRLPAYAPPAPATGPEATLGRVQGTVEISGLQSTDYQSVSSGQVLKTGQIVRTGFNSMAEFEIGGHSLVRLASNSNAVLRPGAAGVELHVLRGTVLWQVYDPAGGGTLVTPTASADLRQGTMVADVKLTGASRIDFLETVVPNGAQIRSLASGQRLTLHAGEGIDVAPGRYAPFAVDPFVVQTYWSQSPVGEGVGGLHGDVQKRFGMSDALAGGAESLLGAATSPGGLAAVRIDFKDKDQALDGIRIRVTPLAPQPGVPSGILIVKADVFGTYNSGDLDVVRKGEVVPTVQAPPATPPLPVGPAGAAAAPSTPAPAPLPMSSTAPLAPSLIPAPPSVVALKDESAPAPVSPPPAPSRFATAPSAAPAPAAAPTPAPAVGSFPVMQAQRAAQPPPSAPAPAPAPADDPTGPVTPPGEKSIFDRQNTKGPQINFPTVGQPIPPQAVGR